MSWKDYIRSRGVPLKSESKTPDYDTLVKEEPMPVPSTLVKPKPITQKPDAIPNFDLYWETAKALGISTGKVVQRAVADFIWEKEIEIYDTNEVKAYLGKLAEKENKIFIWRPLRRKDIETSYKLGRSHLHGYYNSDNWDCRVYDKAVPFDVLQHVKLIEDQFPNMLKFFVSDYAVVDPDPFIMCKAPDMDYIVFGVWDEPMFFKQNPTK